MAADRRTAVLLTPERFTTNPPGTEHVEPTDRSATDRDQRHDLHSSHDITANDEEIHR